MTAPKDGKEKNKGGRPTKYQSDFPERVLGMFKEGASKAEICMRLEIGFDAFQDYVDKYPEFSESVKKGLHISQGWWEMKGRKATVGEVEGFNATSFIFNMKNRFRHDWNDRKEIDHSSTDGTMATKEFSQDDYRKAQEQLGDGLGGLD